MHATRCLLPSRRSRRHPGVHCIRRPIRTTYCGCAAGDADIGISTRSTAHPELVRRAAAWSAVSSCRSDTLARKARVTLKDIAAFRSSATRQASAAGRSPILSGRRTRAQAGGERDRPHKAYVAEGAIAVAPRWLRCRSRRQRVADVTSLSAEPMTVSPSRSFCAATCLISYNSSPRAGTVSASCRR